MGRQFIAVTLLLFFSEVPHVKDKLMNGLWVAFAHRGLLSFLPGWVPEPDTYMV